ncbi:Gfo/Idh/MocA family protein [Microbacterium sp. JB110]|uniref:Gfo/Idh/MocA family protein n=1 Tax=Microbacterium sp. JB110 TaxID=2024477 RepID=UPI00097F438D|nr:Gfo/Idh/MocA family oxidoreductase [Microbacterium sp. JB110]RCS60086.1 gfo/Idh/MocA family oxidoreductase [Microbacterium sp. JB110]SJM45504.1 Oxidoreductase [Frigoribacterium sp. JB110]
MRVAILGAAHPHVAYALDEVAARSDCELVAAAEPDETMRHTFLSDLGDVPVYDRIDDLLRAHEIDIALVVGIYSERASAVLSALDAGAHVVADKPLCTSLADLDRIERRAEQTGLHVSVVFEKRFYPATLALRRLLAEGTLGEVALVASTGPHKLNQPARPGWFLHRDTYGGIAGDLPVHDIDLVLTLSGAAAGTVSALTGNARRAHHPDFDDHVAVLLHAGEVSATIEANWLAPQASEVHGHYRMRVTGTRGTAELDWAYDALTVETHDQPRHVIDLPPARRPAAYFFDAVAAGREPEVTTRQSLLATRVALLAQESADDGGTHRVW